MNSSDTGGIHGNDGKDRATNAAEALRKLGGARVILATAPSSRAMSELIDGLGPNGKLLVVGVEFAPIEVTPLQLIVGNRAIQGWATGSPADTEDTLNFAELSGVRPMIGNISAREGCRSLCAYVERRRSVPRRFDDVRHSDDFDLANVT